MDRSEIMSRIRGKDTKPELLVRRLLREAGYPGYRLHWGPYKIDIAYPGRKIAVFVDSCFWHGCPKHYREPKTNARFWRAKIKRNRERDGEATKALEDAGWRVVRVWGHQLADLDADGMRTLAGLSRRLDGRVERQRKV